MVVLSVSDIVALDHWGLQALINAELSQRPTTAF